MVVSDSLRIVFNLFHWYSITTVFCDTVDECKRLDTRFSGCLRQLVIVYGTRKHDRNTMPMKRISYDKTGRFWPSPIDLGAYPWIRFRLANHLIKIHKNFRALRNLEKYLYGI